MHSYSLVGDILVLYTGVLILVLMEDALVLQIKEASGGNKIVLILVLMEDALVLVYCPSYWYRRF